MRMRLFVMHRFLAMKYLNKREKIDFNELALFSAQVLAKNLSG